MKKVKRMYVLLFVGLLPLIITNCKEDDPIKKDIVITWANPADITIGTPLSATQLNATADVAGTFAYTPPIGTVLGLGASQSLRVDFTPTDAVNNNAATKTVTINVVAKIVPIINWATPADIVVGTLLSATQLNATADVAGTFVYTPPIGTSLAVGVNQDLKVDFTPTDVTNYNTASKTVNIDVVASTVTDFDGNVYNTVTIGTQVWMKENLKSTNYSTGTAIPLVTGTSNWDALTATSKAYCWYNNDIANKTSYGALYTWAAAMNGAASSTTNPSGIQGVCPTGWHLPSDAEWTQMENYLADNGYNYDGTTGGGSAKIAKSLASTSGWTSSPYIGAVGNIDFPTYRNKSGFTALPGGNRNFDFSGSGFGSIMNGGSWWSATEFEFDALHAWGRIIGFGNDYVIRLSTWKEVGFSVRCLQD